jgi:hypothetical protein
VAAVHLFVAGVSVVAAVALSPYQAEKIVSNGPVKHQS